jgi:undecaprenyl diphosphate synthase
MRDLDRLAAPGTREREVLERLAPDALPRHVAIIMDGNGRWAKQRGLPRVEGHRAGIRAVRDTLEAAARLELQVLTLYAFSTENWKRPGWEVRTLMGLLKEYLFKELNTMLENNIRFRPIGRLHELEPEIQDGLANAVQASERNTGLLFQIALNYSGRAELVDTFRKVARLAQDGQIEPDRIDDSWIAGQLATAGVRDPDLLIRTSGELRISNFLLWQLAYSELYFTPVLWPDFTTGDLIAAVSDFARRERRFGGVAEGDETEVEGTHS